MSYIYVKSIQTKPQTNGKVTAINPAIEDIDSLTKCYCFQCGQMAVCLPVQRHEQLGINTSVKNLFFSDFLFSYLEKVIIPFMVIGKCMSMTK